MSAVERRLPPAPAYLSAATLLVWGWQNEFLIYAVVMALVIAGAAFTHWRWDISDREFNLVSDVSSVAFAALVVYVFSIKGAMGIFLILALLPFVFFILIVLQLYSAAGSVRLSTLFISLRRLEEPGLSPEAAMRIDLSLPYTLTCLISASAGNKLGETFFFVSAGLLAIVLWIVRPARGRLSAWSTMLVLVVILGYLGQVGVVRVQAAIESGVMQMLDQYMWRYQYRDPNRASTAIGSIGRLKLSDRIMLRVKPDKPLHGTLLLREATYDTYGYGVWSNHDQQLTLVDPNPGGGWTLQPGVPSRQVRIATYFIRHSGVIPVPEDAMHIGATGATELSRNQHGALLMGYHEGWVDFVAGYGGKIGDPPPRSEDLHIMGPYQADFERLATELDLRGLDAAERVQRVERYFAEGFSYSMTQTERYPRGRYLSEFLFHTHRGHCEFFATATVMLLRAAGVPARYAVGYAVAVDEYSNLEGMYLARARDAHSWAMAYVDGAWRTVDTTPPIWINLGEEQASSLQPLLDLWSWINYRLSSLHSTDNAAAEDSHSELLWLLIPLSAVLAWRLRKARQVRTSAAATSTGRREWPGRDSAFYQIVAELERRGLGRRPGDTLARWAVRQRDLLDGGAAREALALHYRYRFDPSGLQESELRRLEQKVAETLRTLEN